MPAAPATRSSRARDARAELARRELERRRHRADPVAWIEGKLGEHPWSKQRHIARSVAANRYTAVQSAHGTGKDFIAGRLVAWWLDAHPVGDAFAVTSAPSAAQLEGILWREIGRAHRGGNLAGRLSGGNVPMWRIGDELVAWGRKPADLADPEAAAAAFSGIHARHVRGASAGCCRRASTPSTTFGRAETNSSWRRAASVRPDCAESAKRPRGCHRSDDDQEILTVQQVADLTQLSAKTVRRAIDAGHLQASQLTPVRGGWRVYRSAVDDWMQARVNVERPLRPLVIGQRVEADTAVRPMRPRGANPSQLEDGRIVLPSKTDRSR